MFEATEQGRFVMRIKPCAYIGLIGSSCEDSLSPEPIQVYGLICCFWFGFIFSPKADRNVGSTETT